MDQRHLEATPTSDHIATHLLDHVGDLDHTTAKLQIRESALLEEYERNAEVLQRLLPGGEPITGRGWADREVVTATVDAANRLTGITIDPRALRLGSIEKLEAAVLTAVQNACRDVAEQFRTLGHQAIGDQPVQEMLDAMPEFAALLPDRATAATSSQPAPGQPSQSASGSTNANRS